MYSMCLVALGENLKDCSQVVEEGAFIHIRDTDGFAKLDYIGTDSSSGVKLAPVGKCLNEDFVIIGADESITKYNIVEILSEEAIIKQTEVVNLVAADDLNGIIGAFNNIIADTEAGAASDLIDVNRPDFLGRFLLATAISSNFMDVAKALIMSGADVNTRVGKGSATVLMVAAAQDNVQVCDLLVKKGANIDAIVTNKDATNAGYTALHIAASRGATLGIQYLLSKGVDVNATGYDGKDVIEILREALVSGTTKYSASKRDEMQTKYSEISAVINIFKDEAAEDMEYKKTEL